MDRVDGNKAKEAHYCAAAAAEIRGFFSGGNTNDNVDFHVNLLEFVGVSRRYAKMIKSVLLCLDRSASVEFGYHVLNRI